MKISRCEHCRQLFGTDKMLPAHGFCAYSDVIPTIPSHTLLPMGNRYSYPGEIQGPSYTSEKMKRAGSKVVVAFVWNLGASAFGTSLSLSEFDARRGNVQLYLFMVLAGTIRKKL